MVTIYSAVHRPPVAVQLLTFALLPPEVHPDSEADKSGRDQRRRYDDSRQFRYSKKIINNIITLQIESLPHKRNKLNPLIAHWPSEIEFVANVIVSSMRANNLKLLRSCLSEKYKTSRQVGQRLPLSFFSCCVFSKPESYVAWKKLRDSRSNESEKHFVILIPGLNSWGPAAVGSWSSLEAIVKRSSPLITPDAAPDVIK